MAAGANNLVVGVVGLLVLGLASVALWPPGRGNGWQGHGVTLSLRLGLADGIRAGAEAALAASAEHLDLVSAATARQGSSLDLVYRVRLRPGCSPAGLVAELNGLEGVQSVELSRGN